MAFPASLGAGYVHDQGYADYLGMPEGVTIYTDLRFPFSLRQRVNFGSGDLCGQCYLDNPAFDGAMMAIGLYMVGDLPNVVAGARDANITALGDFIRDVGEPVFLRIGYEFDGSWNGYDPALYVQAFRRIMDRLHAAGVTNVVSVWQSSANADIVKAVAYINTRWFDQPAWGPGWGDSRVQIRPEIKAAWISEMQSGPWAPGDFANAANTYVLTEHDLTPP